MMELDTKMNNKKTLNESFLNGEYFFGIELECYYAKEDEQVIWRYFESLDWVSKYDGSIHPPSDNYNPREFTSPKMLLNPSNIQKLNNILKYSYNELGIRTNETCGMHIHFSINIDNGKGEQSVTWNQVYRMLFLHHLLSNNHALDRIEKMSFTGNDQSIWLDSEYADHDAMEEAYYTIDNWLSLVNDEDKGTLPRKFESGDLKYSLFNLHNKYCTIEWRGPRGIFNNDKLDTNLKILQNNIYFVVKLMSNIYEEILKDTDKLIDLNKIRKEEFSSKVSKGFKTQLFDNDITKLRWFKSFYDTARNNGVMSYPKIIGLVEDDNGNRMWAMRGNIIPIDGLELNNKKFRIISPSTVKNIIMSNMINTVILSSHYIPSKIYDSNIDSNKGSILVHTITDSKINIHSSDSSIWTGVGAGNIINSDISSPMISFNTWYIANSYTDIFNSTLKSNLIKFKGNRRITISGSNLSQVKDIIVYEIVNDIDLINSTINDMIVSGIGYKNTSININNSKIHGELTIKYVDSDDLAISIYNNSKINKLSLHDSSKNFLIEGDKSNSIKTILMISCHTNKITISNVNLSGTTISLNNNTVIDDCYLNNTLFKNGNVFFNMINTKLDEIYKILTSDVQFTNCKIKIFVSNEHKNNNDFIKKIENSLTITSNTCEVVFDK